MSEKKEEEQAKEQPKKIESQPSMEVEVQVPSRGKFYSGKLPDGKVSIRPITVKEEKLLSMRGNRLSVIDKLLSRCITSDCIALEDMLISDKLYLLLNLRAISYGNDYSYKFTCGACEKAFNYTVNLPEGLTLKIASDDDVEPFDITLPVSGKVLSLVFLRGKDETEIESYVSQISTEKNKDIGDPAYVYRLSRHIAKIDGKEIDPIKKLDFCESLIGKDSFAIRQAISERETGIDLTLNLSCPYCGESIKTILPITSEFFPSHSA